MAKKKTRGRRQGLFSKAINIGLILLGFSRPIAILLDPQQGKFANKANVIIREATFGLSEGSFKLDAGLKMYTPALGAIALGTLKSFLMRKFPVRR